MARRASVKTFDELVEEVRRYSRTELLALIAAENAHKLAAQFDGATPTQPYPWSLAHIGRIALVTGTDHNRLSPSRNDLIWLCGQHFMLPPEDAHGWIGALLNPIIDDQLAYQHSLRNELARSWAIFGPAFKVDFDFDWTGPLGEDLGPLLRSNFLLVVLLMKNGGGFTLDLLDSPDVAEVFEGHISRGAFKALVDLLTTTPALARKASGFVPRKGARLDRLGMNPLSSTPLLESSPGSVIAPGGQLVPLRFSTFNLYRDGKAAWGGKFTTEVGERFERYAGANILALNALRTFSEIKYDASQRASIDWIVVTAEYVALIECKSARMSLEALNSQQADKKIADKAIKEAIRQINRTRDQIEKRTEGFEHIPADLPFLGVVLTMEMLYMVDEHVAHYTPNSRTPIRALDIRDLEAMAGTSNGGGLAALREYFDRPLRSDKTLVALCGQHGFDEAHPVLDEFWDQLAF